MGVGGGGGTSSRPLPKGGTESTHLVSFRQQQKFLFCLASNAQVDDVDGKDWTVFLSRAFQSLTVHKSGWVLFCTSRLLPVVQVIAASRWGARLVL